MSTLCPRFNSNATLSFPRVFGCLCFVKVQVKSRLTGKLPDRWFRAVHLGFSEEKSGNKAVSYTHLTRPTTAYV